MLEQKEGEGGRAGGVTQDYEAALRSGKAELGTNGGGCGRQLGSIYIPLGTLFC